MSFNRLKNDRCAYSQELKQSTSPLDYQMYCGKYYHPTNCQFSQKYPNSVTTFPIHSGKVQHRPSDLVNLESDLRGQMRLSSLCPSAKYHSSEQLKYLNRKDLSAPPDMCSPIHTNMRQFTMPTVHPNKPCYH